METAPLDPALEAPVATLTLPLDPDVPPSADAMTKDPLEQV
jgi:hypothetical protein